MSTPSLPDLDGEPVTRIAPDAPMAWLWDGYLAAGAVTVLTSQWKAGKTTLISLLLSRMGQGGTLAGREVLPGRAVVVSEEPWNLWRLRHERVGLGDHVRVVARPFAGRPTDEQWRTLVAHHAGAAGGPPDLFVVDPLAVFIPGDENHALGIASLFDPLRGLAAAGSAVLVLHHPRKGKNLEGRSSRGSRALASAADVLMEMKAVGRYADGDRRRRLVGQSRFDRTPAAVAMELSADGRDYALLPDDARVEFDGNWEVLRQVLRDADDKLTILRVRESWPDDHARPCERSLRDWLATAVAVGRVLREGTGRKCDPYVYGLPGHEKV